MEGYCSTGQIALRAVVPVEEEEAEEEEEEEEVKITKFLLFQLLPVFWCITPCQAHMFFSLTHS
jgi:hypothetical protein